MLGFSCSPRRATFALIACALLAKDASRASASEPVRLTMHDAIERAKGAAPELRVAQRAEAFALTGVDVAGVRPNPSVTVGGSMHAAHLTADLTVPLMILGQRGAAIDAARAEVATSRVESEIVWNEVRAATKRAFVALWLAEQSVVIRRENAAIAVRVEGTVIVRIDAGTGAEMERLRAHAETLRTAADEKATTQQLVAAQARLARWVGVGEVASLATAEEPFVPDPAPSSAMLAGFLDTSPSVRRELTDAAAGEARAHREAAAARPLIFVGIGADAYDPGYPGSIGIRASIGVELPILSARGAFVAREYAAADLSRARAVGERARLNAELVAAYTTFEAATSRYASLRDDVLPATKLSTAATETAYQLGRAPLVALLEAERSLVDTKTALIEALATRALAWVDVEQLVGRP